MNFKFVFAWYDFWIGCYWDREKRLLYILPVPCCGIVIHIHDYRGLKTPYQAQCKQCGKIEYFGP